MIDFAALRDRLPSLEIVLRDCDVPLTRSGSRFFASCPLPNHDDSSPSFSIYPDGLRCGCKGCGFDGDVFAFIQAFCGLDSALEAARWLCDRYHVDFDFGPQPKGRTRKPDPPGEPKTPKRETVRGPEIEHYDYVDENWEPLFRVTRFKLLYKDTGEVVLTEDGRPKKDFTQGRIVDGKYVPGMKDVRYVLYRLPAVLASDQVWLCEGERDVHAVEAAGAIATTDPGGTGATPHFAKRGYPETFRGKDVLIVPDADRVGRERGAMLATALHGIARRVRIVPLPEGCKDIRDYLEAGQPLADLVAMARDYAPPAAPNPPPEAPPPPDQPPGGQQQEKPREKPRVRVVDNGADWSVRWPSLKRDGFTPQPVLANAIHAMRAAPEFAGKFAYDEFAIRVLFRGELPWANGHGSGDVIWGDQEERKATEWLQYRGLLVTPLIVGQAVETVARENPFHPVRDYLRVCEPVWDGTARLDTWLTDYCNVEDTPFARAAGAKWMLSAVARVMKIGCKADSALILQGQEGIRKSSALAALADPWFTDEIADLGTKDSAIQTAGVWVIELAELSALSGKNTDWERVKGFMSRSTDRFRPPYGRRAEAFPRQCVFAGTTNKMEFLSEQEGARRFWPVWCEYISLDALREDRDQLWAEAMQRWRKGEHWWIDDLAMLKQAREEQSARLAIDAWDELVSEWCKYPTKRHNKQDDSLSSVPESISIDDVLRYCIGKLEAQWTQSDRVRVAKILVRDGYIRRNTGDRGKRQWRYEK